MATGTTPVTGTVRTGMTGMRPPQPKQTILLKVMQWWKGLNPKQRTMVWVITGMVFLLVLCFIKYQQATAYVNLYENPLNADDLQDVTQGLASFHIPYTKTLDSHITVPPSRRVEAMADLAKQGIPRHPFYSTSNDSTQTHEQFTAAQHDLLERTLTMVIREFNEVADAEVKLVIPTDSDKFFSGDSEEAKAAILVKMKPEYDKLSSDEVKSIINLVAFSVPNLKPENVKVMDNRGRLLSDMLKNEKDGADSDSKIDLKNKIQARLESQIRQVLDKALGQDKYAVAVNADINWNQAESTTHKVGNPDMNPKGALATQSETDEEIYSKGNGTASSGVKQIAFGIGDENSHGGEYQKRKTLQKQDYNQETTRTIVTPGQVQRISASVLVDQSLSPTGIRTLTRAVKNAIGIDEERGDTISFGAFPFHRDEVALMGNDINSGISRNPFPVALALRIGIVIVALAIVVLGVMLYRQQKAQKEKTQLALDASPANTVTDISDLLNDKTGKVTPASTQTNGQQTEKLEQLVKEKPTKVAELLKTTWLSEQ